jgi:hypothetical protein
LPLHRVRGTNATNRRGGLPWSESAHDAYVKSRVSAGVGCWYDFRLPVCAVGRPGSIQSVKEPRRSE